MRAFLRSARIAPKKAAVLAQMIRGLSVADALDALTHTPKKAARMIAALLKSAVANATHNFKQREEELVIRSIIVNQAQSYRRGIPMARGRVRPIRKFLSHIEIVLGVMEEESEGTEEKKQRDEKREQESSQKSRKMVKGGASPKPEVSSVSSVSSK
jgi:large subunit ribosomal protein L22